MVGAYFVICWEFLDSLSREVRLHAVGCHRRHIVGGDHHLPMTCGETHPQPVEDVLGIRTEHLANRSHSSSVDGRDWRAVDDTSPANCIGVGHCDLLPLPAPDQ